MNCDECANCKPKEVEFKHIGGCGGCYSGDSKPDCDKCRGERWSGTIFRQYGGLPLRDIMKYEKVEREIPGIIAAVLTAYYRGRKIAIQEGPDWETVETFLKDADK